MRLPGFRRIVRRVALRLVVAGALIATAASARAIVFTTDYDKMTVLPALTGTPGDQDWRAKGKVTPVKNQGGCDSSWAFAVTGLVEGDYAIRKGMLFNLSEQELLDCTDASSGCDGGSPVGALQTLIARGGLAATSTYPYTARQGMCKTFTPVAKIPGAGRVPPGDEVSLQNYVALGPVLALIDDTNLGSYRGGIFTGPCGNNPTHAVLIVGYIGNGGGSQDYWIVKNSLGSSWGAQGYIFMARHQNLCGIANFALAVSNNPVPAPTTPAIPTLSPWAVGLLLLSLAALGSLALRRQTR